MVEHLSVFQQLCEPFVSTSLSSLSESLLPVW